MSKNNGRKPKTLEQTAPQSPVDGQPVTLNDLSKEQLFAALQTFAQPAQILIVTFDQSRAQPYHMSGMTTEGQPLAGAQIKAMAEQAVLGALGMIKAEQEVSAQAEQMQKVAQEATVREDLPKAA